MDIANLDHIFQAIKQSAEDPIVTKKPIDPSIVFDPKDKILANKYREIGLKHIA